MENNSLDLLSKLLAAENITVVRQKVPTASFDIVNRVIRLPIYVNMQPVQELLLALHEVGHALMTTEAYINNIRSHSGRSFRGFMNVIEDARIERLMKERFPGARKDFYAGYQHFHEVDFFKIKGKDVSKMSFIDRINLDQKLGFRAGVKFTTEEREFVREIETCTTEEEVFDIAKRVYVFSAKKEAEKKEKAAQTQEPEEDKYSESEEHDEGEDGSDEEESDGESEESEEESGESEESESSEAEESEEESATSKSEEESKEESDESETESSDEESEESDEEETDETESSGVEMIEEDPEAPETQEAFDQSVGTSTEIGGKDVVNISMELISKINIVDTKTVLSILKEHYMPGTSKLYSAFKLSNQKVVNHMVKEFEMRKAAEAYKRTTVAKSGSLHTDKLFKYKIVEDIFRKNNIVADSTSHGFIMLLDWSGSMGPHLRSVIGQLLTLVNFCQRTGIKFEVYAFSDNHLLYRSAEERTHGAGLWGIKKCLDDNTVREQNLAAIQSGEAVLCNNTHVSVIKFFSSSMSARETEIVSHMLYSHQFQHCAELKLGGTPLIQALQFLNKYIPMFKKLMNVQKVSVITMTDGASTGTSVMTKGGYTMYPSKYQVFLRSKETNRHYPLALASGERNNISEIQRTLMLAIKENHVGVNFVGFFVVKDSLRQIRSNCYSYTSMEWNRYIELCQEILSEMRKNSCAELSTPGYDKFFILTPSTASQDVSFDGVKSDMSSAQIARQFIKSVSTVTQSRVLTNKFIALVA